MTQTDNVFDWDSIVDDNFDWHHATPYTTLTFFSQYPAILKFCRIFINLIKFAYVEGQTKYVAIYGQIANKFRKNARVMETEINEFFKRLQNISEDEKIKHLERQLDKILSEIENLSAQMKHKLETQILPRIRDQIEELRRRLEKIGKEEKLKYVDQKIEALSAKL